MLYESNYYGTVSLGDTLTHHGIKGQKWGIRRFQNPDGSLTALGKQRYGTVENLRRSQQRKETAKKVAKGVAIGAGVAAGIYAARNYKKYRSNLTDTLLSKDLNLQLSLASLGGSKYNASIRTVTPLGGRELSKMSVNEIKKTIKRTDSLTKSLKGYENPRRNQPVSRKVVKQAAERISKMSIDDLKKKNKSLFNSSIDSILKDMPRAYANMTMDDLRKLDLY